MWIRIRDPEPFLPSIRDGKIRIQDKHPGSGRLLKYVHIFLKLAFVFKSDSDPAYRIHQRIIWLLEDCLFL